MRKRLKKVDLQFHNTLTQYMVVYTNDFIAHARNIC